MTAGKPTRSDGRLWPLAMALALLLTACGRGESPPSPPSPPPASPPAPYAGPLVITAGGTYGGYRQSDDPNTPVLLIRTTEPVRIENATLRGRGTLIATGLKHANLTVRNTRGYALNPNVAGQPPGRFLEADAFDAVVVENNSLNGTSGLYLHRYAGPATPPGSPPGRLTIRYNRATNIDGRRSDGHDRYLDYNTRKAGPAGRRADGFALVQFVQLDQVQNLAGVEIAWNQVVNLPGRSRVEDNISLYESSGTPASPIAIHDNFIHGAYTIAPWQTTTDHDDWSYSGGGIMAGDGPAGASAFIRVAYNQIVATSNYGLAISSGHDIVLTDNRVLACGILPDGRRIAAQNVGAYIWNMHALANFARNRGQNNLIGWIGPHATRNDWWVPDAAAWTDNRAWEGTLDGRTEAAEGEYWQRKVTAARVRIGPDLGASR